MEIVMPRAPDPRVLAVIQHCLNQGVYSTATQLALVSCFTLVFQSEDWWQAMLEDDPEIAALVTVANRRTLH
jgi:uncharacterized protein involved in tolerance to divalent cations